MGPWEQRCRGSGLEPPCSLLDLHFAAHCQRWWQHQGGSDGQAADLVFLAAALVSRELAAQNACLDLGRLAVDDPLGLGGDPAYPSAQALAAALAPLLGTPGEAHGSPLVLDDGRLYLRACHRDECSVAVRLQALAGAPPLPVDSARLAPLLDALFPGSGQRLDWQRVAAAVALRHPLAVITGGPGTGKTTTVAAVLALLAVQADSPPLVRLAAPTGKAAARLSASLAGARQRVTAALAAAGVDPAPVLASLPAEAQTLHRLLGYRPRDNLFRHGADEPLALDVLVLDEASMVDLRLMARVCAALPVGARLILLGDRDQLSSVEAGRVLGDLCAGAPGGPGAATAADLAPLLGGAADSLPALRSRRALDERVVALRESHRFRADSGLGALAAAVNAGDADAVQARLQAADADVHWAWANGEDLGAVADLAVAGHRPWLQQVRPGVDPGPVLAALAELQVLCALRSGPAGVSGLNQRIVAALASAGLVAPEAEHWAGRPVLVEVNDPQIGLYNGDVGVQLADADGVLAAWFPSPDGGVRRVPLQRLPDHSTVFAMTVHKAQGSEFRHAVLVLPAAPSANEARLLSRELLYTGITRAREQVTLCATAPVLAAAVARRTARTSGLAARLDDPPPSGPVPGR